MRFGMSSPFLKKVFFRLLRQTLAITASAKLRFTTGGGLPAWGASAVFQERGHSCPLEVELSVAEDEEYPRSDLGRSLVQAESRRGP